MSPARRAVLEEAAQEAFMMRRAGYPDARVLPEYCIGREIGPDKIMTKTVCIYVGDYKPESLSPFMRRLAAKLGITP